MATQCYYLYPYWCREHEVFDWCIISFSQRQSLPVNLTTSGSLCQSDLILIYTVELGYNELDYNRMTVCVVNVAVQLTLNISNTSTCQIYTSGKTWCYFPVQIGTSAITRPFLGPVGLVIAEFHCIHIELRLALAQCTQKPRFLGIIYSH